MICETNVGRPAMGEASAAGNFVRWGRLGGLETLRLYSRPRFSLLGLRRW